MTAAADYKSLPLVLKSHVAKTQCASRSKNRCQFKQKNYRMHSRKPLLLYAKEEEENNNF